MICHDIPKMMTLAPAESCQLSAIFLAGCGGRIFFRLAKGPRAQVERRANVLKFDNHEKV